MGPSTTNLCLAAGFAAMAALGASEARAALFVVTKTADTADAACDHDCSLREAVIAANLAAGPDVVVLPPGVYVLGRAAGAAPDDATVGDLDLVGDIVLYGESAATTIVDGGAIDRVLDVPAGVSLTVRGTTLRNGRAAQGGGAVRSQGELVLTRVAVSGNSTIGADAPGGGIWSSGAGSKLSITESTVSGNTATGAGGGIAVDEHMTMVNSTVSGNTAGGFGGGIHAFAATDAAILHSTITGNTAIRGGGIYSVEDPFASVDRPALQRSILAGNTAPTDRDCGGSVESDGENVLGDGGFCIDFNPGKQDQEGTNAAPLANNGGTTSTHALLANSPALDKLSSCIPTDQRGQTRPQTGCDIGAFEVGNDCLDGGPNLCLQDDRFRVKAQWRTGQGASGEAQALPFTSDSGLFWFFNADNIELTVEVLDGCGLNDRYWVFLSGLTNVEVTFTVTDTQTGEVKTYLNPLNRNFRPVFDTDAFATCS
jgi:CSLREA domain-containing protein